MDATAKTTTPIESNGASAISFFFQKRAKDALRTKDGVSLV